MLDIAEHNGTVLPFDSSHHNRYRLVILGLRRLKTEGSVTSWCLSGAFDLHSESKEHTRFHVLIAFPGVSRH